MPCPARMQEPNFRGRYSWPWQLIACTKFEVLRLFLLCSRSDATKKSVRCNYLFRHSSLFPGGL